MVTLKLEEKEYFLPESWEEITIKNFKQIYPHLKDEINSDKIFRVISVLTKIEYDIVKQMSDFTITQIFKELNFIFQPIPEIEIEEKFEFQNQKYFIPQSPADIKFGQWVDIEVIKDPIQGLNEIIAIISKKDEDEVYDYGKLRKRIKDFDNLSITIAFAIQNSLNNQKKKYMTIMQYFLVAKELDQQQQQVLTNFHKNGGGMLLLLTWPITTYSKWMKFCRKMWLKCLTFCHISTT